jgi:hypothetical protein
MANTLVRYVQSGAYPIGSVLWEEATGIAGDWHWYITSKDGTYPSWAVLLELALSLAGG